MPDPRLRGLYAITPDEPDGIRLLDQAARALAGGCRLLQYRDKLSAPADRLLRAKALAGLCGRHGAALIVNDDIELAREAGAMGVHLGRGDGSLPEARAALGPQAILGASCYADLEAAGPALAGGADYIAFGAVYPSPTKPHAPRATVDLLREAKSGFTAPVCAIGGITLDNAPPLIAAGVDLLAVITDLFSAPDIAARAGQYQQLFAQ